MCLLESWPTGCATKLNASFIVEAKPGGGMAIGAGYVARAENDGHTLLLAPAASVATLNEIINPALPYRGADFAPIALLAVVPQVLTVARRVTGPNRAGVWSLCQSAPR